MNDLIKEFFYDGIGRLIPGACLIAIYSHDWVFKFLTAYSSMTVLLVTCLLALAWFVGAALEAIIFPLLFYVVKGVAWLLLKAKWIRIKNVGQWLQKKLSATLGSFTKTAKSDREVANEMSWQEKMAREALAERKEQKSSSERSMFRSLGIVCLIVWLSPTSALSEQVRVMHWWSLLASGFCFVSWYFLRKISEQ